MKLKLIAFGSLVVLMSIVIIFGPEIERPKTDDQEWIFIVDGEPWQTTPEPNDPLGIPTWPEYIELDKDLVIKFIDTEDDFVFGKGTKIYFKDE